MSHEIIIAVVLAPFFTHLILQIAKLEKDNARLVNVILRLTTGQNFDNQPEPPLSSETKAAIRKHVDDASDANPVAGYPSFSQLLAAMESSSFKRDADETLGEEIVSNADLINAKEATSEEDHARELNLRKKMQQAAARAVEEYRTNAKPVELGDKR